MHCGWIALLCLWVNERIGRFGFSPTDQGFILGLSWRIQNGEIPHQDVISARPLGSAVLHVVDLLLPGPLFMVSNLLSMLEIVLMTIALTVLVTGRPLLSWSPALTGLVAAASLINLHTKSLTAWHTVDGLMLTACGLWALDTGLRSGRAWPRRTGLVLLGLAVLTKQSFALAGIVGLFMLAVHPGARADRARAGHRWWVHRLVDLLFLAGPGLLYVGVVASAGGMHDLFIQLSGAQATVAGRLFLLWGVQPGAISVMAVLAVLLIVVRLLGSRLRAMGRWLDTGLVLAFGAVTLFVVVGGDLARAGNWGIELFWLLLFACLVDGVSRRAVPWRGLLIALVAWMCSLSWGYDSPTLLGGTLALTAMYLLAGDTLRAQPAVRHAGLVLASGAAGLIVVVLAGWLLVGAHDAGPYRDRPQRELIADLGAVVPSMSGIRTNTDTFSYIAQIRDCTERYPAGRVAVLPDNAFAYPALRLHNPFPMDWPRPLELVADARARMLAAARRLDREGDYLVLFQTVSARTELDDGAPVPGSVSGNAEIVDYDGLQEEIRSALSGERVTCGSFVGVWSPR